jgi:hypothetical protein
VATAYLCVDNQSALDTLHGNASQTQYSRTAANVAAELYGIGWKILDVWTPAHGGKVGNEAADTEAKAGAAGSDACKHARTTKRWLLSQTRQQHKEQWTKALPGAVPSFSFPANLRCMHWSATRTLWQLYAGRTPSDRDPSADHDKAPEPCDCGDSFLPSAHILLECRLFLRARTRMLQKAPDMTLSNMLRSTHTPAIIEFMETTGLGYTTKLRESTDKMGGDEMRRGGGDGSDGGSKGDGVGDGGRGRAEVDGHAVEGEDDECEDEWRFGLFE